MTEEEILVRLKMDGSQLDAETRKSMQALAHLGKEHHKWWQHAGTEARAVHSILEKITDASPAAGLALKLAMDPMVGVLSAVAVGFGFLMKQMDAAKEKAKESARALIEFRKASFTDPRDIDRAVAKGVMESRRELGYDLTGQEGALRAIEEARAAVKTAQALVDSSKDISNTSSGQNKFEQSQKAYERFNLNAAKDAQMAAEEAEKALEDAKEFERLAQKAADHAEDEKRIKRELYELDIEDMNITREKNRQQLEYNQHLSRLQREKSTEQSAAYIPSISELSRMNTPVGRIAREVLLAQEGSKQALGMGGGNLLGQARGFYADFQAEGGAAYRAGDAQGVSRAYMRYGNRMQGLLTGRTNAEGHLQIIAQQIVDLNTLALGEGLKVQGAN